MNDYSDIMDHSHHQSKTRPHLPISSRAAQFSPFAALTGYDEAVRETDRLTVEKMILDDDAIEEINRKLNEATLEARTAAITYFVPDLLKEGGEYIIASGRISKVDVMQGKVTVSDGTVIPMDDIIDVSFIDNC